MDLTIKQLKQHNEAFVPLTTAEAVLVKDGEEIITLDNMLQRKIERVITPVNSGLVAYPQGTGVILTHSNSIEANTAPTPVKLLYDNRGHIIGTAPMGKATVVVDTKNYMEHDGSQDLAILLSDDFGIDEKHRIILKWNYI